jgi:hypothetical protein
MVEPVNFITNAVIVQQTLKNLLLKQFETKALEIEIEEDDEVYRETVYDFRTKELLCKFEYTDKGVFYYDAKKDNKGNTEKH